MKLKIIVLASLASVWGTSIQADDTKTPEILSSVSSGSLQNMTKEDSVNTRGEYVYCNNNTGCRYVASPYRINEYRRSGPGYYESLKYAGGRWNAPGKWYHGYFASR
jgi:hypothetical protein